MGGEDASTDAEWQGVGLGERLTGVVLPEFTANVSRWSVGV